MADDVVPGRGEVKRRSRRRRLSRSAEFDRVYRNGRSHANRYLVVYAFPRADGDSRPRLGVSVGRKVGGSAERSHVKRLLREAFWARADELPAEHDFVLVARPDIRALANERGEPGVREMLDGLLAEAGMTRTGVDEQGSVEP